MKKKLFLLIAVLLAVGQNAFAYDFSAVAPSGQTLYYNLIDGEAQVTYQQSGSWDIPGYSNLSGSLVIPDSVEYSGAWYAVTSIGNNAFHYCNDLTSVTIGGLVTSIGSAFNGCSGLTSVAIPNSVTSIGNGAFNECSGLTSVTIPNSVTYIGSAFSGCSGLTSIVVEAGNTHYDSRDSCNAIIQTDLNLLIQGCMTTIIPNSVTSIGRYAFFGCSGLTSVTIPNSVTSIVNYAFENCSGLLNIVCESVYPPSAENNTFFGVPAYCTLTVPCGSLAYYSVTAPWNSKFQLMNEDCRQEHTVTVVSADSTMGTVSGGGQVQGGDVITITATANAGYRFVRWNDNDIHAVRTVTVTSDMTFTAYFEALPSEGIDDAGAEQIVKVYAADGRIYIDAPQPVEAAVYDMTGRRVATLADCTSVPMPTGVYLVKVGTLPARKVVVLR